MFVRGGLVNPGHAGFIGYYWSSVGRNSSGAYALYFNPYGVVPSNYDSRYYGLSIRCVALGG